MPCFGHRKKTKRRSPHVSLEHFASEKIASESLSPQPSPPATTTLPAIATPATLEAHLNPPNTPEPTAAAGINGRTNRPGSVASSKSIAVAQIRQEYNDLKNKQTEHLDVIARQSAELEELRQRLNATKKVDQAASGQPNVLQEKEELLQQRENEIKQLLEKIEKNNANQVDQRAKDSLEQKLAEQEQKLREKERQLEELMSKKNQAELIKPALDRVTQQLNELKVTNQEAVARLAEKEKELSELRSQLSRRRPAHRDEDEARQKRLNRLTMDLESDRLMIQKLEELNQQLEAQKQKHEAILQSHAKEIAEKDRELIEQQQSLADLKLAQEKAIKALEQKQAETVRALEARHMRENQLLKDRLENAERRAKSDMNDEVEKLLHEFEQAEHNHSVQLAHLHKSHQEQLSAMKQGQEAELKDHIKRASMIGTATTPLALRRTGGPTKTIRWPVAAMQNKTVEVNPRDPATIQVYISSVSANPTIKRNQESLQTMLTANQITFQVVDVAQSEPALQHMRRQNHAGGNRSLPQVFVGGEYRGQYQDMVKAVEEHRLAELLQPRNDKSSPVSVRSKASFPNEPITPTSSTTTSTISSTSSAPATPRLQTQKGHFAGDDDLFRDMEKEFAQSDFSKIELNF